MIVPCKSDTVYDLLGHNWTARAAADVPTHGVTSLPVVIAHWRAAMSLAPLSLATDPRFFLPDICEAKAKGRRGPRKGVR